MLENDRNLIDNHFRTINSRHSFDDTKENINPYKNKKLAQKKCTHMWANDTDAIYIGPKGRRKCAICGKEF